MNHDNLYSIREAARAAGVPVRRLAGWLEQHIFVPTVPATGSGSRRGFSGQDVLRVAILAEVQNLFGINLRPGKLAGKLGGDALVLPYLDAAASIGIRESDGGQGPRLLVYAYASDNGLVVGATREGLDTVLKTAPAALVIDVAAVWRRVRQRLDRR
jgi:MerR HTH family regulatory protein